MKNLITLFMLSAVISLASCTKIVYTQQQVLDRYKGKTDISKKFGTPNQTEIKDSTERWLYAYKKRRPFGKHASTEKANARATRINSFNVNSRYLIFELDKRGNVLNWKSKGLDLAERKNNPAGTIILVAGSAAVLVGGILLLNAYYNPIGDFQLFSGNEF